MCRYTSGNVVDTIEELKAEFFSALQKIYLNAQWLCERAILAPRNDCVAHINNQLLDDFPGDVVVYKSIDTVPDQNAVTDPTKFLNSLELLGMPPHILKLKVGAPVMVLQNINPLYLQQGYHRYNFRRQSAEPFLNFKSTC